MKFGELKIAGFIRKIPPQDALLYVFGALVPCAFLLLGAQTQKCQSLRDMVSELEDRQRELVEENRRLVADISELSSSERIESAANSVLYMHRASAGEIIRVEMTGGAR